MKENFFGICVLIFLISLMGLIGYGIIHSNNQDNEYRVKCLEKGGNIILSYRTPISCIINNK